VRGERLVGAAAEDEVEDVEEEEESECDLRAVVLLLGHPELGEEGGAVTLRSCLALSRDHADKEEQQRS
jgi:hypothetical protein